MKMTRAMKKLSERWPDSEWKDEGDGYASFKAKGMQLPEVLTTISWLTDLSEGEREYNLAYVSLPSGHPDIGKDYSDLRPDVNGGLTYGDENVFGWDYFHAFNSGSPDGDIKNALEYFREREKGKTWTKG